MKILSLCLVILFAFSCKEEIQSYNDLTEDEKEEIRRLAASKCSNDNAKPFAEYKEVSNRIFSVYYRGMAWKVKKSNSSSTSTNTLYVWKTTPTAVYFLHKYYPTAGNPRFDFIKLNSTINSQMIDNLNVQMCDLDKSQEIKGPPAISISSNKVPDTDGEQKIERDTTNSSRNVQPAFFSIYNKKIVTRTYKADTSILRTDTEEESLEEPVNLGTELNTQYPHYTNTTSNRQFCIMKYVVTASQPNSFKLPYELKCEASDTANVNTSGDPLYDFVPATEL